MINNLDTNINNYSDDELLNLLELDNIDYYNITNKIDFLINNHFKTNANIRDFFFNVKARLLSNIENFNNIEIENEIDNETQNETDNEIENETDNETDNERDNEIESFQNLNEETNIDTSANTNLNNNLDTNIIPIINSNIEHYTILNYLHFNTLFRAKTNPQIFVSPTNSNFILSNPINNISQIKLASINIKKPFLISDSKSNNKFIIKKFNISNICDFSNTITITNGYYDDKNELEVFINNYFKNFTNVNVDPSNEAFMNAISFSIDSNSYKIKFDLCYNSITTNNIDFLYYVIDFKTNYVPNYSLANILGFDYFHKKDYYNSIFNIDLSLSDISTNNISVTSPYTFSNIGNSELFFCFDEYQSNIIETHKLFLNNNMATQKILAKIDATLGNKDNNYYINQTFSKNNDRNDIIRKYDGTINLLNFNIKIIDYYGNIINTNNNENYTFTIETILNLSRIKTN